MATTTQDRTGPPRSDRLARKRASEFLDIVFPRPRSFAIRYWTGELVPTGETAEFTLVLRSRESLRRMLRVPVELSLGEAYLRGDFDIEGDLGAAFALPHTARSSLRAPRTVASLLWRWARLPRGDAAARAESRRPVSLSGGEESRDRARAAIQYHYDVGNDFYHLFLDRRMMYSCGYFERWTDDLDTAQQAKLEHICRKLMLEPGQQLLDIGCGWGGLLIYAAERFGVRGTGVTLSAAQCELARARVREAGLSDRIRIELRDYRDLDGSFDRIVSVGMFEHVGRARFREYFEQAFRLLRPGGHFLNHSIANRPAGPQRAGVRGRLERAITRRIVGNEVFRKRYIFPDAELAPLSRANLVAEEAGFEIRDVENLREHYALTLRHWLERLRARRSEAVRIAGEPVFRLWEMYLAGSAYHFETGRLNINQSLMSRLDGGGRVVLPPTRAHLYEKKAAPVPRSGAQPLRLGSSDPPLRHPANPPRRN